MVVLSLAEADALSGSAYLFGNEGIFWVLTTKTPPHQYLLQFVLADPIGIYMGSYVAAAAGVHLIVNWILRRYQLPERGLKRAGATTGVLARMLVLTLVLLGQYASIALIFTAKSIARFEELKDREFAEYYLIGTLSSILFAMLVGILTTWVLEAIRP
jgi:hypothetical protein